MTSWLAAIALAAPGTQQAETVRIGQRDVPLEFPAGGLFPNQSPSSEPGPFRYELDRDGQLRKFVQDGGWGDIRARYLHALGSKGRTPVPILAVLTTRVYILEAGPDGVVRQRRGVFERGELDTVYRSLALLKACIDASGEGKFEARVYVVQDDDPAFLPVLDRSEAGTLDPGRWLLPMVAPYVNEAAFETDDGRYSGPYAGVFAIQAGLTGGVSRALSGRTPVTVVPYFGFSQEEPGTALGAALYDEFRHQVAARRTGTVAPFAGPPPLYPTIDGGPTWLSWLGSLGPSWEPPPPSRPAVPGFRPLGDDLYAVPVELAEHYLSNDAVRPAEVANVAGTPSIVVSSRVPIGIWAGTESFGANLLVTSEPRAAGLHSVKPLADGAGFTIERSGRSARGYVEFPAAGPGRFAFRVRCESAAPWHLTLVGSDGRAAELLLCGSYVPPVESGGEAAMPSLALADGQWHEVVVDPAAHGISHLRHVRVGAGSETWKFERPPGPPGTIEVTAPAASTAEPTVAEALAPADVRLARLAAIGSPASDADVQAIRDALASPQTDEKANALAAIARANVPGFVPELTELSRSPVNALAYLALRTFSQREDAESRSLLLEAIERAPFEHCRRFAIELQPGRFEPKMSAVLSQMGARSWRARLAGVRALGQMPDQNAQILMVSTLVAEPEPLVRLEVSQAAQVGIPLVARRILYAAVNDPSEAVRAASLARLLDCPIAEIRSDALSGVRDESPAVRLALLAKIGERKNDGDRQALRLAVTDPLPIVRAAALDALASQPGPVAADEVANVARDPHPAVSAAYARLARAKGFAQR